MASEPIVPASLGLGLLFALSSATVLFRLEDMWALRPRPVALAATLGAALADALLIAIGGWLGWQIGVIVATPRPAGTVAVALFAALAATTLLDHWRTRGARGGGEAELPDRPAAALRSFAWAELLAPRQAILAAALVLAWPGCWRSGGAGVFIAVTVVATGAWRLLWAMDGRGRRRKWGSRAIPEAVTILTVGALVGIAVAALPR